MPHPEMNPLFFAYKRYNWDKAGRNINDYPSTVLILPHKDNNRVWKEILAEEGSSTPRAFLTKKVVKLNDYTDEYNYLDQVLANGHFLTDQITTSDSNFFKEMQEPDDMPLEYNLNFKKDAPEHIILNVSSNENSYLALMDLWSRGWTAYIDGKEIPIYRGYIGTRFIKVEVGKHIVEFKYRVPGFAISSIVSFIIGIILILILIGVKLLELLLRSYSSDKKQ